MPIISDAEFDSIFEDRSLFDIPGLARYRSEKLPVWVGSLNKARDDKSLQAWLHRLKGSATTFVVSGKLDGISAVFEYDETGKVAMYSRGDGMRGCNLSSFIPLCGARVLLGQGFRSKGLIRGELIMKRETFKERHSTLFSTARNLVAGQFNRKSLDHDILADICYVPYEIISPDQHQLCLIQQLALLKKLNLPTPPFRICSRQELTREHLNTILDHFTEESPYTLDGLVISVTGPYERNEGGNPSYAIAFKPSLQSTALVAVVDHIEWNMSQWGIYIPVIHIQPVFINGIFVTRFTGHNARNVVDNQIGPGAQVLCMLSGNVIPHVVKVLTPWTEPITLPSSIWSGVHLVRDGEEDLSDEKTIRIKAITSFLTKASFNNVKIKTVEKLYDKCGIKNLVNLLQASEDEIRSVFPGRQGYNIWNELSRIKVTPISVSKFLSASSSFGYGMGEKRMDTLLQVPDFLSVKPSIDQMLTLAGYSRVLSQQVHDNYETAMQLLQQCSKLMNIQQYEPLNLTTPSTKSLRVCLSGFRDDTLETIYTIVTRVTKNTDMLIVKSLDEGSLKVQTARRFSIPIKLREEVLASS